MHQLTSEFEWQTSALLEKTKLSLSPNFLSWSWIKLAISIFQQSLRQLKLPFAIALWATYYQLQTLHQLTRTKPDYDQARQYQLKYWRLVRPHTNLTFDPNEAAPLACHYWQEYLRSGAGPEQFGLSLDHLYQVIQTKNSAKVKDKEKPVWARVGARLRTLNLKGRYAIRDYILSLDPQKDYQEIVFLSSCYEFPFDTLSARCCIPFVSPV